VLDFQIGAFLERHIRRLSVIKIRIRIPAKSRKCAAKKNKTNPASTELFADRMPHLVSPQFLSQSQGQPRESPVGGQSEQDWYRLEFRQGS